MRDVKCQGLTPFMEFILYPPYKNDGHRMFFEIGGYWKDVLKFLDANFGRK